MRSFAAPRVVNIRIGVSDVRRMRFNTSKPSIRGSITSRMIRRKYCSRASRTPSSRPKTGHRRSEVSGTAVRAIEGLDLSQTYCCAETLNIFVENCRLQASPYPKQRAFSTTDDSEGEKSLFHERLQTLNKISILPALRRAEKERLDSMESPFENQQFGP